MKKYLTEFIGTFFFVLVIGMTGNPLAIGASLMIMIYAGGHISGAHYNPAVTLAVLMRGRIKMPEALTYMGSQLAGALLAGLIVGLFKELPLVADQSLLKITPMLAAEVLGTFALAYVVLNVATAKANSGNSFYGIAIGFTIFVMATAFGEYSGGAFNPAVAVGGIVMKGIELSNIWIYLVACFGGAALAAVVFNMNNVDDK